MHAQAHARAHVHARVRQQERMAPTPGMYVALHGATLRAEPREESRGSEDRGPKAGAAVMISEVVTTQTASGAIKYLRLADGRGYLPLALDGRDIFRKMGAGEVARADKTYLVDIQHVIRGLRWAMKEAPGPDGHWTAKFDIVRQHAFELEATRMQCGQKRPREELELVRAFAEVGVGTNEQTGSDSAACDLAADAQQCLPECPNLRNRQTAPFTDLCPFCRRLREQARKEQARKERGLPLTEEAAAAAWHARDLVLRAIDVAEAMEESWKLPASLQSCRLSQWAVRMSMALDFAKGADLYARLDYTQRMLFETATLEQ